MGFKRINVGCKDRITKMYMVGKMTQYQYRKLVVIGEPLNIFVTTMFPCEIVEIVETEER